MMPNLSGVKFEDALKALLQTLRPDSKKEKMKGLLAFHSSFQYDHPYRSILIFVVVMVVVAVIGKYWKDND
jgi:hypothetical protein